MKDTVSFAFVTKSKPYGTFTPVSDVRAYIRMQVPDSMTFEQFRMHLYLLEGEVPLENITALVTPTMLEERASVLEAKLDSEIDLTASDADSFNFHGIHAQQVSDAARKQNLATFISGRRVNGDNALTCTGFGRLDPAGGVVSGTLNTESGLSTVYLTDYIEFEAGKNTRFTPIYRIRQFPSDFISTRRILVSCFRKTAAIAASTTVRSLLLCSRPIPADFTEEDFIPPIVSWTMWNFMCMC
jgi:hypothetical protein